MNIIDEKEIIKGISNGSKKAFNELYIRYSPRLYSYCFSLTKSHEDAEEIVHDVFVKIWKSRQRLNNYSTLSYLIFHIAKNELINSYKKSITKPIMENYIRYNNELSFHRDMPDNHLELNEFIAKVKSLSAQLPEKHRKIFNYKIFDYKSNKEISELTGLQEQTIKNVLCQIMKSFRPKLKEFQYFIFLMVMFLY